MDYFRLVELRGLTFAPLRAEALQLQPSSNKLEHPLDVLPLSGSTPTSET